MGKSIRLIWVKLISLARNLTLNFDAASNYKHMFDPLKGPISHQRNIEVNIYMKIPRKCPNQEAEPTRGTKKKERWRTKEDNTNTTWCGLSQFYSHEISILILVHLQITNTQENHKQDYDHKTTWSPSKNNKDVKLFENHRLYMYAMYLYSLSTCHNGPKFERVHLTTCWLVLNSVGCVAKQRGSHCFQMSLCLSTQGYYSS